MLWVRYIQRIPHILIDLAYPMHSEYLASSVNSIYRIYLVDSIYSSCSIDLNYLNYSMNIMYSCYSMYLIHSVYSISGSGVDVNLTPFSRPDDAFEKRDIFRLTNDAKCSNWILYH